jgi:hypothetical protein
VEKVRKRRSPAGCFCPASARPATETANTAQHHLSWRAWRLGERQLFSQSRRRYNGGRHHDHVCVFLRRLRRLR